MLVRVHDPGDPRLADYIHLRDANLRRHLESDRGLYLAEGAPVIARALAAGHRPRSVLVGERRAGDLPPVAGDVPCYVVPDELMAAVTGFDVHRGAMASMHRPPLPDAAALLAGARRIVVLEDLTNHTNVGAIFRSAAALGVDAVLVTPKCADPLYRRAVRVSMGSVFQVPWTRLQPWPAAITTIREAGFTIAALTPGEDAVPLDAFAAAQPERIALVFGTEAAGVHRSVLARADVAVRIPMAGGVSSLNVAAAAAVACWALRTEVAR